MFDLASLYALTPRDLQVTPLSVVRATDIVFGTATASPSVEYTVPADRVFVLQSYFGTANAVSGVTTINTSYVSAGFFDAQAPNYLSRIRTAGGVMHMHGQNSNTYGTTYHAAPQHQPIILLPDDSVYMTATFSAINASNFVELSVHGVLIPRGNFSF